MYIILKDTQVIKARFKASIETSKIITSSLFF